MTDDARDRTALECAMLAAGPARIERLAELTGLPAMRVAALLSSLLRAGLAIADSGAWALKKPAGPAVAGRERDGALVGGSLRPGRQAEPTRREPGGQ